MDFIETAVITALILRKRKNNRQKRFWVHPIVSGRLTNGQFYKLFDSLSEHPDKFFQYFRMSNTSFDYLLSLVKKQIIHQDTRM